MRRLYVFVFIGYGNVVEWLSELEVLVFVIVDLFLFVVVDGAEPLPGQGSDDERVLLDRVLLEGVLFGYDAGVVIVVQVYVVVLKGVQVVRRSLSRSDVYDVAAAGLGLAIFHVVQLLVVVVVEGGREVALLTRAEAGRGGPVPLPRAERQDRAHVFLLLLQLLAGPT